MQTHRLIRVNQGGILSGHGSRRYMRPLLAIIMLLGLVFVPAVASRAALLSETYSASSSLPIGSIVSMKKGSTDRVDSATTSNANYIFGVTVNSENSQLSISSSQNNQVSVATDGIEQVLVSDINGDISAGEPITASPIQGVGMKATSNVKIIGVARDNFPNASASKHSYKDQKNQQQYVMVGQAPVLINVAYYYKQPDKTIIPSVLQSLANALAGKKVSPIPILISLGIFIVTMIIVVSMIYSMIHSSIISVGRNPLSQAAVYRNVIQLSGLVIIILGVAVGSIYMILTRL